MEYLRAFKLLSSILTSLEPYESGQAGHQIPTCYSTNYIYNSESKLN